MSDKVAGGQTAVKFGIVMPVGSNPNREWWEEALNSIVAQDVECRVMQVIRREDGQAPPPCDVPGLKGGFCYYDVDKGDKPSAQEQAKHGFSFIAPCDYVSVFCCNDVMLDGALKRVIKAGDENPDKTVFFPNYICTSESLGDHVPVAVMPKVALYWRHPKLDKIVIINPVTDVSQFRYKLLSEITMDATWHRKMYRAFFLDVLQKYGSETFHHIPEPMFLYRQHRGALSRSKEWISTNTDTIRRLYKKHGIDLDTVTEKNMAWRDPRGVRRDVVGR